MLYFLFDLLDQLNVPGSGIWQYISFRAGMAFVFSMFIATYFGMRIIRILQKKQIGETIRNLGLEGQMSKKGTPTMGGVIIILSILVPTLLLADLSNTYILLMIITTLWMGVIGFTDDYIKVFRHNKEGMHGKTKIVGQVGLGLIVGIVLFMSPQAKVIENVESRVIESTGEVEVTYEKQANKSTVTTIPFLKNHNFDYADPFSFLGKYKQAAGWIFCIVVG